VGYFVSYVSFVVGSVAAAVGLNCLIQRALYQGEWMDRLECYMTSAVRVSGAIADKSIAVDPFTGYITYSVTVEYDGSIVAGYLDDDGSNANEQERFQLVRRTFDTKSYPLCRDLYEHINIVGNQKDSANIEIMLSPGAPLSGTPTRMMERKFRDFFIWHHVMCPLAAIVGPVIYLVGAWEYASLVSEFPQDVLFVMSIALLALVLMVPLTYFQKKDSHEKKISSLALDPSTLVTEIDSWRRFHQFLGPTLHRKMYAVLFVIGIFSMFVMAGPGALFGYMLAWSWILWSSVMDRKRKFLQAFQRNADLVSAFILSRRVSSSNDSRNHTYYVTFRYAAPCGAVVEKEVCSEALYHQNNNVAMEVRVLKHYPRSGIPVQNLTDELNSSCCTSWIGLPVSMVVGSAGYFGISWLLYIMEGDDMTALGVLGWLLLLLTALSAVLPQGYVLCKVTFQRFVSQFLKEAGTVVVPCPETCRHETAEPQEKDDDTTCAESTTTCESVELQQLELL
jgi:hypothetical protein